MAEWSFWTLRMGFLVCHHITGHILSSIRRYIHWRLLMCIVLVMFYMRWHLAILYMNLSVIFFLQAVPLCWVSIATWTLCRWLFTSTELWGKNMCWDSKVDIVTRLQAGSLTNCLILCLHFYICLHWLHKVDLTCTLLKGGNVKRNKKNLIFRFYVAQALYNVVKNKRVEIEVFIVWWMCWMQPQICRILRCSP